MSPFRSAIAFLLVIILIGCQDNSMPVVSFVVITPSPLHSNEKVFITGDQLELGFWRPDSIPLQRINDTTWRVEIALNSGQHIEYKFSKGSWDQEAVDANNMPFSNSQLKVNNDTLVITRIEYWKEGEHQPSGQITGQVRYHRNIEGRGLKSRDLIVWLPPEYDENPVQRFPVLYLHDGQNIIDPETSSFGVDWQADETADQMIRQGLINPIIIVGIYNTRDRSSEYSPGEKGSYYMEFLVNVVKPMVDSNYRTMQGRKYTYVGGSSMGGLISLMLAWEYSEVFGGAMCMSPAFKVQEYDYVDDVQKYDGPHKEILLYVDNGTIGIEQQIQPGVDEMLQALKDQGFRDDINLKWYLAEGAKHNEAAWAKRLNEALLMFFRKD